MTPIKNMMNNSLGKKIVIAIDGPAASGKSTTAQLVARALNYLYIDTGAMFRALTLEILDRQIPVSDEAAVVAIARQVKIELKSVDDQLQTFLNGADVSDRIRLPRVTQVISEVSAYRDVREIMKIKQQEMAVGGGVVMDGRDIGTVVLPDAEVKIFMQASVEERSQRRIREMQNKGITVDPEEIRDEIVRRDAFDSAREFAPLKPAESAHIIDTSGMTIAEQVQKVLEFVRAAQSNEDPTTGKHQSSLSKS